MQKIWPARIEANESLSGLSLDLFLSGTYPLLWLWLSASSALQKQLLALPVDSLFHTLTHDSIFLPLSNLSFSDLAWFGLTLKSQPIPSRVCPIMTHNSKAQKTQTSVPASPDAVLKEGEGRQPKTNLPSFYFAWSIGSTWGQHLVWKANFWFRLNFSPCGMGLNSVRSCLIFYASEINYVRSVF